MSYNNYLIGVIGEIALLERLTKLSMVVSLPYHQDSRYDMIVDHNNTLYKIQVKTTHGKHPGKNGYRFDISSSRFIKKHYHVDHVDYFACYAADIDSFWIVPYDLVGHQKSLYIRPDNPKYFSYKECYDFN